LASVPWPAAAQTPLKPVTPPPAPPTQPVYRGFTPGISYRAFVERAQALSDSDVLRCQTSPRTAQVMECGVVIRDPKDAARFYLSAHFIDGNADVVAFYDSAGFGDRRGVALLDRTKKELARLFGRPRPIGKSGWEWPYGRRAAQRGGMLASPSRAPSSAPATAAFVSVSPPASAREMSASSSDGRWRAHQKAISTQCTTYPASPTTASGRSLSCSQATRPMASIKARGAAPCRRWSTSSRKY